MWVTEIPRLKTQKINKNTDFTGMTTKNMRRFSERNPCFQATDWQAWQMINEKSKLFTLYLPRFGYSVVLWYRQVLQNLHSGQNQY